MKAKAVYAPVFVVGLVLLAKPAAAHHGDAGRYEEKLTTLTGTLVEIQLINPHSVIVLDIKDEEGKVVTWRAELGSVQALKRWGLTRDTLKSGDAVTIVGRRVKTGAPFINLTEMASVADGANKVLFRSNEPPPGTPPPPQK